MLNKSRLTKIWESVPVDYYQNGVKKNFLQSFWHTNKLKTVLGQIRNYPVNILDVGCASGWFLSQISLHYPKSKCTGIDPYRKTILYGRKLYSRLKLKTADAHHIPYLPNTFDLVVCTEVIEHVLYPSRVLKEIYRVSKKSGAIIIEMDSGNWLFNLIWSVWTKFHGKVWHNSHLHPYNAQKLKKQIINAKLKILEEKYFNYGMAVSFLCTKQ